MESERFNNWLQMAGMIGIIASLIFVGLQLKQSQDIAVASQYGQRASDEREFWQFQAEHSATLAAYGARHREHLDFEFLDLEGATDEEIGLQFAITRAYLASWDNNHFQYESGFMTQDAWSMYEARIRTGCTPGRAVHTLLTNHSELYRPSFVEFCLRSGENES